MTNYDTSQKKTKPRRSLKSISVDRQREKQKAKEKMQFIPNGYLAGGPDGELFKQYYNFLKRPR